MLRSEGLPFFWQNINFPRVPLERGFRTRQDAWQACDIGNSRRGRGGVETLANCPLGPDVSVEMLTKSFVR